MIDDDFTDLSLNIQSSPPEQRKDETKIQKSQIRHPKLNKKKYAKQFKEKTHVTEEGQKSHTVRDETESQGRISSLFAKNPEIPRYTSRAVRPVCEPVFSSQLFKDLPLHPFTVSNLDQNLGLQKLTTVQQKAIPLLLSTGDALIRSQTGSGKTLAYALPIIEELQSIRPKITRADGIRAVVVVPTRELALQTYEWFIKLVKPFTWIVPGYLVGGEKRKAEKARLRKGITVLIGTPGRLLDHIEHTKALQLNKVSWLVLDEADRLLDMGYEKDVGSFVDALNSQQEPGSSHKTVLLSATLTNAVERLAGLTMKSPTFVDAAGDEVEDDLVIPESLKQFYILTPAKLRLVTLSAVVRWKCQRSKMLIFFATQDMVDFHTELLVYGLQGIQFFKLHGNMTQSERTQVFKTFRTADSGVLLCTDVAARGLDLPRVDCIVQYTGPSSAGDYVHRVGRTARVGTSGEAILFLTPSEVQFLRQLENRRIRLQEQTVDRCLEKLKELSFGLSVEEVATSLQARYEEAVVSNSHLHDLASKAFVSWVRFYASYPKEVRESFSFKAVHLGHYAKSFALRDPPSKIGGIGRRQFQQKKHQQQQQTRLKRPRPGSSTTRQRDVSEFSSGLEPMKKKKRK